MLNTDHQRSEAPGEYRPLAPPTRRVLWIDDEVSGDWTEVQYLRDQGIAVCCAQPADSGLARLESDEFEYGCELARCAICHPPVVRAELACPWRRL